jgi:glycosyl transferase family 25
MKLHAEMINLERARERREKMRAELAQAGVSADFYPAFDLQQSSRDEMLAQCRADGPWGAFHDSNMAITISHAQVWERFLSGDADLCLVMEDDIFISPDLGAWLDDLSWWPKDAGIVKIERWRARRLRVLLQTKGKTHLGRNIKRLLSRHVGAAGYILTRDAATALLAERPFALTIDNLLFNFNASPVARNMKVYQIDPALVEQGNEPPQSQPNTAPRHRPTGMALLRQKLKRAYFELAYPASTLAKALAGQARLARITYAAHIPQGSGGALHLNSN